MKKRLITAFIMLGLVVMLTGCGNSGITIIDMVSYNTDGTMVSAAKKYMESRDLIYEEQGGIHNTVADQFLGYRAYYDIDVDDFYIYLTFDSEQELTKASKDIKKYFAGKADSDYKKSDLCEVMEEKPRRWRDIFAGASGNVYVIDYEDNRDGTFDYEAVLYCAMSDLDIAKAANGYILGDLNTYIAISVKGATGVTLDTIMGRQGSSVAATESAAAVADSSTADSAVATESAAAVPESDSPTIAEAADSIAMTEEAAAVPDVMGVANENEETGDIGLVIYDIEEVDKEVGTNYIAGSESDASIYYVKLPTKEGILLYKSVYCSPVYVGYLIYYLDGKTSYVQVSGQSTALAYVESKELFVGSESYTMDTYNTCEYGIVDGEIREIGTNNNYIESYNGISQSDWTYYETLDEAILN